MKSAIFAGLAASASAAYLTKGQEVVPGQYIISLATHMQAEHVQAHVDKIKAVMGEKFEILHVYSALAGKGFSGYAAKLSPEAVEFLLKHSDVLEIEEDQIAHTSQTCTSQASAPWGLRRTNIRGTYSSGAYQYISNSQTGTGVDVYVIDTGVRCSHTEFASRSGATCRYGVDYIDGTNVDGNGHGTHVAGTVAGKTYGVAKLANIVAVRVLGNDGSGTFSGIIAGINWALNDWLFSPRPGLSNLSLGGGYSANLNSAVTTAHAAGMLQVVAAGNDNMNACSYSPASAPYAYTVGATDQTDKRATYSNYGSCLDIFGPGTSITSAWYTSDTALNTISGTSMATPHVAGVAAKYLSQNPYMSSSTLASQLTTYSTKNIVVNESGGDTTNPANVSPDRMVFGHCTQP